jgi:hypothetical protein
MSSGLRSRKNTLITALKAKALAANLSPAQVETFDRMYRAARSEAEQDEVSRALDIQMNGWKTATDGFSRVLQAADGIGELGDEAEDDDTPAMKEALARSRVSFVR